MNLGIIWFLRWFPITSAPFLIITAVLFAMPGMWEYIASMWLSKRGRKIFRMWWLRIPPIGLGLMLFGWFVHVLCNLIGYIFLWPLQKLFDMLLGRNFSGYHTNCKQPPNKITGRDPIWCNKNPDNWEWSDYLPGVRPGPSVFMGLRKALGSPWFLGIESIDFASDIQLE